MTQSVARQTITALAREYPRAVYTILVIPESKRRTLAIACQTLQDVDSLPTRAADLYYEWAMTDVC